jgi:pantoate--beta-alanine ligase
MTRDLNLDVEIVVCPIVRGADGLAMSSRNAYLNPQQRQQALVLSRSLQQVRLSFENGEPDARKLIEIGSAAIAAEPAAKLDYFAVVNPDTLEPVSHATRGTLVAVAAWVGTTRLIDNTVL